MSLTCLFPVAVLGLRAQTAPFSDMGAAAAPGRRSGALRTAVQAASPTAVSDYPSHSERPDGGREYTDPRSVADRRSGTGVTADWPCPAPATCLCVTSNGRIREFLVYNSL